MKKIVVTGAAGFIGSHLVEALAVHGDLEILAIDNLKPSYGGEWSKLRQQNFSKKVNFEQIDLSTHEVEKIAKLFDKAESVIHLAGWAGIRAGQLNPLECEKSNLISFENVLKAVEITRPNHFLFASSSSIYGDLGSLGKVKEVDATGLNLQSYYSQTKWRNEKLRITQRVHAKWSEVYGDRDDAEANDAYYKMLEEAMAEAEKFYKDRPANS
jgi:UDP-glucuronate 4-epimerase